jgi:cytoskeletal protein RodZ
MSIGQTLMAAREAAGLSIDDVSRATRVRGQLIRQIEHDDFSSCGGQIYARGHIRNIAHTVGIDPGPLVAEFDRSTSAVAPQLQHIMERGEIVAPDRSSPNWTGAMFVAAVVLFVIAVAMLTNGGTPPPQDTPIVADSRPVDAPATTPSATPKAAATPKPAPTPTTAKPKPTPSPPVVALTGVNVRVSVTGDKSWVSVRNADTKAVLFQEVMSSGQVKDFKVAKKMSLVIGNAGAVRLVVNGRDLGAPGGPGQVVRVSFGPGDPAAG